MESFVHLSGALLREDQTVIEDGVASVCTVMLPVPSPQSADEHTGPPGLFT